MKISYNWLQNYFEQKLPTPEKVSEGIIFHSFEIEGVEKVGHDIVFDVKVLPDRAHDCLSHWGIAKEVSAIFDMKISSPNGFLKVLGSPRQSPQEARPDILKSHIGSDLKIEVEDPKCLRYMGRIVRNIKVDESPHWLKEKLSAIGQRSINNIVDAANFVMFDLGQPIHSFDLDKLASPKIIVRNGKVGERLTTLDKKEVNLDESILIIADDKDPLAIAGIKGGTKAEVDNNTKNIVIEVANFNHTTTRKTSKKINILTDAVKRYENEISPELASIAMDAVSDLIYALAGGPARNATHSVAGGEFENIIDVYPKKTEQKIVSVTVEHINKRLGTDFSKGQIESVWKKLNFEYKEKNDEFEVTVPYLRIDITGPHDLVEEVVRILGYEKVEEKLPRIKLDSKINDIFSKILFARNKLLNDGYSEVMTYVFRDKGDLEVLASASDKKFLRTNLTDGLKESIKLNQLNLPLLDMDEVKVFEIGTVFLKSGEEMHIAYGDKKNIKEMILDKFTTLPESEFLKPSDILAEDIEEQEEATENLLIDPTLEVFKPWSMYPFITRDIAVWVPEGVAPEKLIDIYKDFGTELLVKEPKLFDSFTKPALSVGEKERASFAYHLVFQSYERTLTDEEVNQIMSEITEKIISLGWEVR